MFTYILEDINRIHTELGWVTFLHLQNVTTLPTMDIAEDVSILPHMFVVDDVGNDGDNVDHDDDVDSPVYILGVKRLTKDG